MSTFFIYRHGLESPLEANANHELLLSALIEQHGEIITEEVIVFDLDREEPLEVGITIEELGLHHGSRLLVTKCKEVKTTVSYAGIEPLHHEFRPHTKIEKVLEKSLNHFQIPPAERSQFGLFKNVESQSPIDGDQPISAFAHECSAKLYLSKIIDIKG